MQCRTGRSLASVGMTHLPRYYCSETGHILVALADLTPDLHRLLGERIGHFVTPFLSHVQARAKLESVEERAKGGSDTGAPLRCSAPEEIPV